MKRPKIRAKVHQAYHANNSYPARRNSILVITLAAAILAVALISYLKSGSQDAKASGMNAEAITEIILDDHSVSFASRGIVDESKISLLREMPYAEFKDALEAGTDFCVYLEDVDGRLIFSKGSSKLKKDIAHCNE